MTTEPSGRGVRGMLNELLHGREDEHDHPAGEDGRPAPEHDPHDGDANGTGREPGRYSAAHDPEATVERPAPGTVGSGVMSTSGIGGGPRPGPRPAPPAPPVAGAHRLAEPTDGDGSLFHGRDAVPAQAPAFGPREQRNWAGTGGAVPPAAPQPPAAPALGDGPDGADTGSTASAENGRPASLGSPDDDGPGSADDRPAAATPLPPSTRVVIDRPGAAGAEADPPGPDGPAPSGTDAAGASDATPAAPVTATEPAPAADAPAAAPTTGTARRGTPSKAEVAPLERLVPLDRAQSLSSRWDAVKGSFVDEPRDAVRQADGLVGELLDELDRMFREQRSRLEQGLDDEETTTEDLRLALRRYRSFFDRLIDL